MKTAYTNETGIRPWECIHPIADAEFTTTTLINRDFNSVWDSWCDVMGQLSTTWPFKREWSSATGADFNSKAEEYLFRKDIAAEIKSGDFLKKNDKSNIYSTLKNRPNNPRKIERLALQGSHDVILAVQKNDVDIEKLWEEMTSFETHITPEKIRTFLKSQPNTLICRFYDAETHAAAQFIYPPHHATDIILEEVKSRFQAITIEDIHIYINYPRQKYNSHTTKPSA